MIDMDSLLLKCPQCGAWPVAANFPKSGSMQELSFKCSRCQHVNGGRLRRGLTVQRVAGHAQGPARP